MNKDKDLRATTERFFAAYDAHDVEGMLTLCADGAQGRYLPYGKNSVMPIRGGLEKMKPNVIVHIGPLAGGRTNE